MRGTKLTLAYINRYTDRHGNTRHYFRRPGHKQVALPGKPGSKEFMAAYQAALSGSEGKPRIGASKEKPGSFGALLSVYYDSAKFRNELKPQSQKAYRILLEQFRELEVTPGVKAGDCLVKDFRPAHLNKLVIDGLADRPGQAKNMIKCLRGVFKCAIRNEMIDSNPAREVETPKAKSKDGIPAWSDADIEAFCKHWPSGTKQRLALALLLYTGQRRSDVARMGRQHVREGRIHVRQMKTDARLAIRIHSELQKELDLVPPGQMTFMLTEWGKPFSLAGFSIWFKKQAEDAGVQDRSAHGLRKAAGRMLAEAGCTAKQIMAILGHQSMTEAERYTRTADQEKLGDGAMELFEAKTRT
ncbi:tyrosine-type recombinase/integrase [Asticcacaulis excentricus]|uniref:Integrase family protein n=1 Tax=Asticcacaulis excentricus (strain ATCC 15261 / DSM 4724 / KCTC 12464 / NCIMB 9791 / VKM B-1370 / CB 48) TaxID=573065 RepID=E8RPM1_ASTEC|nr:tyrosine-type recombinase/integrase [Asticcacaulis excentricus]ADU11998.1 integrase family protein [Asticcacaulis excentricus CB 48]